MTPIGFDTRSGALLIVGNDVYPPRTLTASLDGQGMVKVVSIAGRVEQYIPWSQVSDLAGDGFTTAEALMAYLVGEFGKSAPIGGVVTLAAGMDLGGHKALMFAQDGSVIYADPTDPDYVFAGVSLQAGASGDPVNAITDGLVIEPSWAWAPLQPVYVGSAGVLTQTPPTAGFFHLIGRATSATSLMVAPEPLVVLA